jgi:DNA-binding transcriptional LysR family regulator
MRECAKEVMGVAMVPRRLCRRLVKESDMGLIILIIVLVILFGGGGGYYWHSRRRR